MLFAYGKAFMLEGVYYFPMAISKYKIRCKKCGVFFLPYKSAQSRFGICNECRMDTGRCRALTETGYQCNEKAEVMGYCMWHFLHEPMKTLVKEVKKL